MGWRQRRFGKRRMTAAAVVLAVIGLPQHGWSQAAPELSAAPGDGQTASLRARLELVAGRVEAIEAEEAATGPTSVALIDMLRSLALLYAEEEEYGLAAQSVERALHIHRVNHGLNSTGQIPILRQLIAAERSAGHPGPAQEQERRLLRLARLNSDDVSTYEIFEEAADQYVDLHREHLEHGQPAQIGINFNAGPGSSANAGPVPASLRRARWHYGEAIAVILGQEAYDHEALPVLERKLLGTYYLELIEGEPTSWREQALYVLGKDSLMRLLAYAVHGGGALADVAETLVELGDFELLFSRHGTAHERYQEAYELLAEHDEMRPMIEELFAPQTPVAIPSHWPNPILTEETHGSSGYVDVAFQVSKFGRSRRIRIVDVSADAADAPKREVVRLLAGNRFRPQLVDGTATDATFVVRYHY